mmetsp:Transcript_7502/g.9777  ORF Transcript_7502/g.9777 Transcript_7502/m.9777 type:complete len:229 (-) Transcript_7502:55-741(-)|eukprot:CAMPEP_0198144490 /NCGR_PEP_ID=MMETSP1443-20131203/16326_1 /TAXON_ID=186043 /ORGANISM="Entomoneis sp., Strain CCMP2396" /LENGTH=228 /DNA_ID=CAMNT_0043807897 /DNA_START=154 /DNA_END=837 /DNA_ORIENTATION=-
MSASTKNSSSTSSLALAVVFAVLPVVYYQVLAAKRRKKKEEYQTLSSIVNNSSDGKIKPPFPQTIRDMLSKARLAYLSTVDLDACSSHLSLMRFTYLHHPTDGEIVIMSTSMNTKKFLMLQKQEGVAMLVHDFQKDSQGDGGDGGQYSITLNGDCRIVQDPQKAKEYQQAHLQHNPDYPQFIVGDGIAILCIDVSSARICNIHDQVIKWDKFSAAATAAGGGEPAYSS